MFSSENVTSLQNIQDCRSDSLRHKVNGDDDSVNALLELFIAGKSQSYFIPLTVSKEDTDHIFVSGVLKLNIADFDLVPPKKVFGLIKVSEHIEIDFKLNLIECE